VKRKRLVQGDDDADDEPHANEDSVMHLSEDVQRPDKEATKVEDDWLSFARAIYH
jgi:hypothetical protein